METGRAETAETAGRMTATGADQTRKRLLLSHLARLGRREQGRCQRDAHKVESWVMGCRWWNGLVQGQSQSRISTKGMTRDLRWRVVKRPPLLFGTAAHNVGKAEAPVGADTVKI